MITLLAIFVVLGIASIDKYDILIFIIFLVPFIFWAYVLSFANLPQNVYQNLTVFLCIISVIAFFYIKAVMERKK